MSDPLQAFSSGRTTELSSPARQSSEITPDEAQQLALDIAQAADERKGADITILRTSDVSYLADYFVIVTAFSAAQSRAIARTIEDMLEENWSRGPLRTEGQLEGSWILQDYGDVIVHIFLPAEREFYNLEAFWGHAQPIEFVPTQSPTDVLR
ncbi:MAG: ribosome silencing factor [Leptolyngbyaceae cyanobacterium MO_188.B28]|nr:ribosome silencing factor [Leptolyngbyaceae cyanobacterium MO_188.B28]